MAEFVYNNAKSVSTSHIFFELNCGDYSSIFYKEDINLRSKLKLANELSTEFQKLMIIY